MEDGRACQPYIESVSKLANNTNNVAVPIGTKMLHQRVHSAVQLGYFIIVLLDLVVESYQLQKEDGLLLASFQLDTSVSFPSLWDPFYSPKSM